MSSKGPSRKPQPLPPALQALQKRRTMIPIWFRTIVTSVGLAVATIRTMQEYRPRFDPATILEDSSRVSYIRGILTRVGIPPELAKQVIIVVGEHNGMQGSSRSSPGPILELTPQLSDSLTRRAFADVNMQSDVALGMRVKTLNDKRSGTQIPILCEFPFELERQAVIAHEAAHLALDHSSGLLKLNALMAFSSIAFWIRPVFSMIPIAFYAFSYRVYTQHSELAADKQACKTFGPELTQAMINRFNAKKKLDKLVMGKYSWDQPAYRSVITEMVYNELFHVTLDKRLSALEEILKEQKTSKKPSL